MKKRIISIILCVMLIIGAISVYAVNSEDATIIESIAISEITPPYAGECPNYSCKYSNSHAYTYDDEFEGDSDVVEGKWWYDETANRVLKPTDTFIEGHIYTLSFLLVTNTGYEFKVDEEDKPLLVAYVNGEKAITDPDLTKRYRTMIEYTFPACEYNYEITEVEINIATPVPGGHPGYAAEILTPGVITSDAGSPYYIEGVTWYDRVNQTYLDPSHSFSEDGVYEVNIMLTTIGDFYFATKNDKTTVNAIINGKKGVTDGAGMNDAHNILASCVLYGDAREVVEYVEVNDIDPPVVGESPDFTGSPARPSFYINSIFWTDITDPKNPDSLNEGDVFEAGHTYELMVWVRTSDNYKFYLDEDGYIDIAVLAAGMQADVALTDSDVAAEFTVTFTLPSDPVISFVDVINIDAPIAGEHPDFEAFCTTRGCNVSEINWYDITEAPSTHLSAEDTFEAGRSYSVVAGINADGNHMFEVDDIGANIAEGTINGQKAIAYSSYDEKFLELGLKFAPCPESQNPTEPTQTAPTEPTQTAPTEPTQSTDPSQSATDNTEPSQNIIVPTETSPSKALGILGDADENSKVNVKDATAIQKHVASLITLSEVGVKLADADRNNTVNVKDATTIQKHVAGMETGHPIGQEVTE